MQFILSGLTADADERSVHEGMALYFQVTQVNFIREGDADSPWAVVKVRDDYVRVWEVANRLRGVFHRGKALKIYIPAHQPDAHLLHPPGSGERIDIA